MQIEVTEAIKAQFQEEQRERPFVHSPPASARNARVDEAGVSVEVGSYLARAKEAFAAGNYSASAELAAEGPNAPLVSPLGS